MAEQQQDVDTLKRRGRRRLVGAVALVLLAVIVLPMVFDPEPRPGPAVSVRIPGEDEAPFKPKPMPEKKEAAKPAENKPPQAAAPAAQFIVPVGAYANPESVIAKLTAAKVPHFTEEIATAKGKVTRVRAGPFASKEAAEKAAEKLKELGFQPGTVAATAG